MGEIGIRLFEKESCWNSPEFLLVVVMLLVLLVLVLLVLWAPIPNISTDADASMALDYRQSVLSVIITAFGAWVGAGAAYYFGRENLREASQSLLAMKELSPEEKLRRTLVSEIPPRVLDWVVEKTEKVGTVLEKLKNEPVRWFIPVTTEGVFETVIGEEAIWRYISDSLNNTTQPITFDALKQKTISDVISFVDKGENKKLKDRVGEIFVNASLDDSAAEINDAMARKNVTLAIITDENQKPVNFITTGDVRRLLLKGCKS